MATDEKTKEDTTKKDSKDSKEEVKEKPSGPQQTLEGKKI